MTDTVTTEAVDVDAIQRRTIRTIVVAKIFGGAGLAAGITVGALLAQDMLGSRGLAGVPAALFTLGSAGAAIGIGRLSSRAGRRPGLAVGYAVAAAGGLGVIAAAVLDSVTLLFLALLIYGAGTATNLQARYAAADLARPDRRARAIGSVLVATTVGAVAGPNLVGVLGDLAAAIGIPRLAGPFLLAAVADGAAAVVVWTLLRPDPLVVATALASGRSTQPRSAPGAHDTRVWNSAVLVGVVVLAVTHMVMLAIMTMTPVYMRDHHHGLRAIGLLMSIHVACMYLPSPLAGALVDRWGPTKISGVAALVLALATVTASLTPPSFLPGLAVSLGLLGFGWSLGLVAGTTTVTDNCPLHARARVQGTADLVIALSSAAGGLASGFVVSRAGYDALTAMGLALAGALLLVLLAHTKSHAPSTPDDARERHC